MKILFLITGMGVGGAERQVADLADNFFSYGHEVIITYMVGEALVKPTSEKILLMPLRMKKNIFSSIFGFFKLLKIIKKYKPDVIHSHMVHANLMARLSRILFPSIPVMVSTAHSTYEGGKGRMLAYRYTDFIASISTNVSEEAVKVFEQKKAVPKGRMIAIHNGIDVNKFAPNAEEREKIRSNLKIKEVKVFLAVGRLVDAKDYPNLLEAFSQVLKKNINCRLLIAGDGPLREKIICYARELNVLDFVIFLGVREDIPGLMNAADFFVLPSAWEGFGLVVAEAMASEKIVIATNSGGVSEVLGESGFLVPVKDPSRLADAMLEAFNLDMDKKNLLRKSARQRVIDRYSLERVAGRWLDLYKELLSKNKKYHG